MKRYIGITDFAHPHEVGEICKLVEGTEYKIMVGIMMSYKSLYKLPTSWAGCWPDLEAYKNIFQNIPKAYNTLHYADYNDQTDAEDLKKAIRYCGENLHALQLDMIWPHQKLLSKIKDKYPSLNIIFQLNQNVIEKYDGHLQLVYDALREYDNDLIDVILMDMSMGTGKEMDVALQLSLLEGLQETLPDKYFAAAGGLGPGRLDSIIPLLKEHPISIDAQSKLRRSGNAKDPIDWDFAAQYVKEAIALFNKY